ncbi:hypothetical protein EVAR_40831_1 [Eumeta japonica]|uniref:Uncharacterized protein n=1 Tax=Eumeta variegata TaxID=151549 RepID=A0A4C1WIX0_EUMVA|nr:hypothetical protein EVAR_40831_1 [Eumeta japonica]
MILIFSFVQIGTVIRSGIGIKTGQKSESRTGSGSESKARPGAKLRTGTTVENDCGDEIRIKAREQVFRHPNPADPFSICIAAGSLRRQAVFNFDILQRFVLDIDEMHSLFAVISRPSFSECSTDLTVNGHNEQRYNNFISLLQKIGHYNTAPLCGHSIIVYIISRHSLVKSSQHAVYHVAADGFAEARKLPDYVIRRNGCFTCDGSV